MTNNGNIKKTRSGASFSIKQLPERTKLLILSLLVGVCSGLAAVLLHKLIGLCKSFVDLAGASNSHNFHYLVFPGVGMLLSLLFVKYLVKDNISHGVTKVLVAVSKNESKIKPHNMFSSLVSSALTIGFGGSVGAEAPIVYTGAAIGSNFARYAGLSYRNMTTLLGCGAAGAIAGIFKAPMAGVLFTMEVLLFNISMSSLLPLLLSTVSATVVAYIFTGQTSFFACSLTAFSMGNIPFYILLGIVGGLMSLYFLRTTLWLEDKVGALKNPYLKWAVCALALGVLIFLFPPLYGEGYGVLGSLLGGEVPDFVRTTPLSGMLSGGWGVPLFFLMVIFLKVLSMTATNAGGGVGGTFGPTLFVGALVGFVLARSLNLLLAGSTLSVPEQNFVLVGMAALMAGVMQAPLTAIFLIAEISGGYDLFLPLILTATISYGITRLFERYSIYTKRISQTGELLTHDNDQAVLTLLKTQDLVRDKYPRINIESTLREIIPIVSRSAVAVFPVLDSEGRFQGVLDIDVVRRYMLRTDLYDKLHVRNIMDSTPAWISPDEPMETVMRKFDSTDVWRLPVLTEDRKYLGFISKSRLLMAYREELKQISQD